MSAETEYIPAYPEVEPIVRAYQNVDANEWIVDWNQTIDPNHLPLDIKTDLDKEAKRPRRAFRGLGATLCGMVGLSCMMDPTPQLALITTGSIAVIGATAEVAGRSLGKTFAKDKFAQFGTHEQHEHRRLRIPEAVLILDPTITEADLYTSIKDDLLTAYEPNTPASPLLLVDQASKEEVIRAIPTMRIDAFKKYFEINPAIIDAYSSEEELITAQLQNPTLWYTMPDELIAELGAIAKLDHAYRLALHHQETASSAQESIAVLPDNIVRQTADDPAALEFMLPELVGYVGTLSDNFSLDQRTHHLARLATKIASHSQRRAIMAS